MLVLSRKPGEKIQIGRDVTVTVVALKGGRVRIGLEAPAGVAIRRSELSPLSDPCSNPVDSTMYSTAGVYSEVAC